MSGHSKWASIKHKKGALDKKRGKLFAKLIKQVEVAARQGGGDLSGNATLRTMVQKARDASVPNDTIERAIKRGTGELEGILQYSDEPLVSTDIIHSSYSSIFDSDLTMVNGNLVKVFGWYDNEWGYSCRLVDLVARIAQTIPAAVAA